MVNNPTLLLLFVLICCNSFVIKTAVPYNVTDSKEYAYLSSVAYCPKKCIQEWSCKPAANVKGIVDISHISNALTVASSYVAYNKKRNQIVLSFRGSSNIQNWIENFNIEMIAYDCKNCQIHAGFFADYLAIEQKINQKVSDLLKKYPSATILTTGHSLGAALSLIAGLRLRTKFNVQVDVHNFGCPRLGNAPMAQFIFTRVDSLFRVVHNKDIVPHLPPENYYYHHTPYEVFFNEHMDSYVICSVSGQDKNCSNKFAPSYSISDHNFYLIDIDGVQC